MRILAGVGGLRISTSQNNRITEQGQRQCEPVIVSLLLNLRKVNIMRKDRWDNIVYNLIDYPSIEHILKDFNQDFIQRLPFLDENFISNILKQYS